MEDDPLYLAAAELMRKRPDAACISSLQRGLLIGYNRASRLMESLIDRGVIVRTYSDDRGVEYTVVPNA